MVWVMQHRWWVLAAGLVLYLFGRLVPGQVNGVPLAALGFLVIYLATLAILRVITVGMRSRRAAHRPSS
jgi:hypothetical protein